MGEWDNAVKKVEHPATSNISLLRWEKPGDGVFKLNVDGTRAANGMIGVGGVIRDWNGSWIHGFMLNIGIGEVLQAEAWGLFSGLQLAKDLGINHIMVESDSAILIALLHSADMDLHPLGTIIQNCKNMISWFATCSISHIHRERNMTADCLAKRSIEADFGLCRLPDMPEFVAAVLLDDMAGRTRPRTILVDAAVT